MKFSIFVPYGYELTTAEVAEAGPGWPWPPRVFEPERAILSHKHSLELWQLADSVGFDWLALAEHHYAPRQMTPSPLLAAAALSQHTRNAGIAILGVDAPLTNPVRTAEEYAMLDVFTEGRLAMAGFFRGTPNEYLTYGGNAAESRDMYEEAVELVVKAWTTPEPFGWEGRHYQYRVIAPWPRPVQQPHPPVLVSGNSPASADFAIRNQFNIGLAFMPLEIAARAAGYFRDKAAESGWQTTPDNVLYRTFVHVAETDEEARQDCLTHGWGGLGGILLPTGPNRYVPALMEAGKRYGGPAMAPPEGPVLPALCGSPGTVLAGLEEIKAKTGAGIVDLIFSGDTLPHHLALRSVELFGTEVIPNARGL
jgi:alkanesulfonate monooxygenase SsuD/methylene tetrahydromethanopterin reductase-like flavin-dependent oxidoreductase (luciferase family)